MKLFVFILSLFLVISCAKKPLKEVEMEQAPPPPDPAVVDHEKMTFTIKDHNADFRKCLEKAVENGLDNSKKQRQIVLIWTIDEDGNSHDIKVESSDFDDEKFEDCMISVINRCEFPKMNETRQIRYPFIFNTFSLISRRRIN